jgi:MFS family permease
LLAGLTGTFLAGPLHQPSPALTGLAIFLTFGSGVLVQTTTTSWPAPRLVAAGIAPIIIGLCVLVASGWTSPPSLALFLTGAAVAGAGIGAIIRGSLTVVITTAGPDDRAGALATFFIAGYAGVSLPVVGVGLALQHLSPRVTLLIFAVAVTVVILAAAPILVRPAAGATQRPGPDSDPMTALCRGFGEHADRPAGGCQRLGPADRSFAGQPERRRPIRKSGRTQHPTLGTLHRKTSEAGPEHLPTSSLPTLRACSGDGSVPACVTDSPVMGLSAGSIGGLRRCGGRARRRALHLVMRV